MPPSILHHVSVGVADVARARAFYSAVLAPVGATEQYVVDGPEGPLAVAYGRMFPEFWINNPLDGGAASAGAGAHTAFIAPHEEAVRAFYAAALAAGGTDAGAPGLRPEYGPGYYAAYVYDLDNNKIEAAIIPPGDLPA